jgi:ATP synthase protein I
VPAVDPGLAAAWLVRATVLPTGLLGVALVIGSGLVAGGAGALGAALGCAVVIAFFGLDLLALRSASRRFPDAPVQLALVGYLAKLVGLGVGLWLVRGSGAIDAGAFAVAALAGTVVWLIGQIRVVGRLVRLPVPPPDLPAVPDLPAAPVAPGPPAAPTPAVAVPADLAEPP